MCTGHSCNKFVQASSIINLYRLPVKLLCRSQSGNKSVQATTTITLWQCISTNTLYRLPV